MGTVRYTTINGEIIAEKRNGVRRTYVPDAIGSTVALLDNTQTKTDTFSYWPYGEEKQRTGSTPTPFRFVGTYGYYRDQQGALYVRARVLRPRNGLWMTSDPLSSRIPDAPTYRYSDDTPISKADPTGLACALKDTDCTLTCKEIQEKCRTKTLRNAICSVVLNPNNTPKDCHQLCGPGHKTFQDCYSFCKGLNTCNDCCSSFCDKSKPQYNIKCINQGCASST
jgi:RHS repeat-associated protein